MFIVLLFESDQQVLKTIQSLRPFQLHLSRCIEERFETELFQAISIKFSCYPELCWDYDAHTKARLRKKSQTRDSQWKVVSGVDVFELNAPLSHKELMAASCLDAAVSVLVGAIGSALARVLGAKKGFDYAKFLEVIDEAKRTYRNS